VAGLFSTENEGVGLVYCIVEDESILDDVEARVGNEISPSDVVEVLKQHVEVDIRRSPSGGCRPKVDVMERRHVLDA
jgi:hypothetical protein